MTKKITLAAAFVAVGILLMGCGSVDTTKALSGQKLTADGAAPVAHIHGNCWGIYFLPTIPLLTGDCNAGGITFMSDNASLDHVVGAVTAKSASLKATKTTDVVSSKSSIWLPFPLPIFWYKSVSVSGNAIQ